MSDAPDADLDAPACTVYYGSGTAPAAFGRTQADADDESAKAGGQRSLRRRRGRIFWRPADEFFVENEPVLQPTVLMVDASILGRAGSLGKLPQHIVIVAADEASEHALGERAHLSLVGLRNAAARFRVLRTAGQFSAARLTAARRACALAHARAEVHELNQIGMALTQERDLAALLRKIVEQGKRLTKSDAGALMLLENDEHGTPRLHMTLYHVDSLDQQPDLSSHTYPVDSTNLIGHSLVVRQPVIVADAYDLPRDAPFQIDHSFDLDYGYRTRSVLVVPMVDHRDVVVGVLLFVNRKRAGELNARITSKEAADRSVTRYTGRVVRLARALAGQAAVSIENARLSGKIEQLLESFVKAAASAIDERDPCTAGHSVRVATLCTELAQAVEREGHGDYRDVRFTRPQMRELRFAALLHDLGKVAVREDVLIKAKKLPPALWERVRARFALIRRTMEVEYLRKRASLLLDSDAGRRTRRLDDAFAKQLEHLENALNVVRAANEPSSDLAPLDAHLAEIARLTFESTDAAELPYLTAEELRFLQIPHGTLDDRERTVIESHVDQTYRFLAQIPWTDDLKNLPVYAGMHHEKLDGTGYPRRVKGRDIPIQSRMITIADIFDALTESDRPYRGAMPPEKALDLLRLEAKAGQLDSELVRIMIESQVYRKVRDEDWPRL